MSFRCPSALYVARAFDKIHLGETESGTLRRSITVAIRVAPKSDVGDVFRLLKGIAEVRSVDTLLIETFGIAVVTFFKPLQESQLQAVAERLGADPVGLEEEDFLGLSRLSSAVVLGPAAQWPIARAVEACRNLQGCEGVWVDQGRTVADLGDCRRVVEYRMNPVWCTKVDKPSLPILNIAQQSLGDDTEGRDRDLSETGGSTPTSAQACRFHLRDNANTSSAEDPNSEKPRQESKSKQVRGSRDPPMQQKQVCAEDRSAKVDAERILSGSDRRTTCVVCNIPKHLTRDQCTEVFDRLVLGKYNCFVLPVEPSKASRNLGWGLINFVEAPAIVPFYSALNGKPWGGEGDGPRVEVTYAKDQGVKELMRHWGGLERKRG
mmetsp:Transcript_1702/g.3756  ORF Transcript_1702/g.3756 Transcript_1702/m.3756 type:complete len:378 (+) Transcript_1702:66-1199(+)